jgi:hypothetical protein
MISYLPGKQNIQADVLSRREQDMLNGQEHKRFQYRTTCLVKLEIISKQGKELMSVLTTCTEELSLET